MPKNYVILYNPADPNKCEETLDKTDQRLRTFATDITAGTQSVKSIPLIINSMYKNIEALDAGFTAGGNCTGCGLCERMCPVKNIRMDSGKPQWLHHCEHCVACISWCPVRAIEYADKTKTRRLYRNPRITVDELIRRGSAD